MKIVVLGGTGLVGSAFKRINTCHEFIFPTRNECDLVSLDETKKMIQRLNPDWVINCAGIVGGVKANMEKKQEFLLDNINIGINVIKACLDNDVRNVISFLSTCVFPDEIARERPLNELDLHKGEPHSSNYPYAHAKRIISVFSQIAREKGYNYNCVIPTNIFGFNDNYNLESSHLVPALIHKCYQDKKTLQVWGTGKPIRQFIFDLDIANIILEIIEKNIKFDNLIISSNKSYTIREIAEKVVSNFEDKKLVFDSSYPDGQYKKETDTYKFRKLFPNFKFTDIDKALSDTIVYFKKNYNSLRL